MAGGRGRGADIGRVVLKGYVECVASALRLCEPRRSSCGDRLGIGSADSVAVEG